MANFSPDQVRMRDAASRAMAGQIAICAEAMTNVGMSSLEALACVTELMLMAGASSAYELALLENRVPDKSLWLESMDNLFDRVAAGSLATRGVHGHG